MSRKQRFSPYTIPNLFKSKSLTSIPEAEELTMPNNDIGNQSGSGTVPLGNTPIGTTQIGIFSH